MASRSTGSEGGADPVPDPSGREGAAVPDGAIGAADQPEPELYLDMATTRGCSKTCGAG